MLARLVAELRKGGADNSIVSLSKEEPFGTTLQDSGFPVHYLAMRAGVPRPAALFELKRIIDRYKPNVVQGWMYHANIAVALTSRFTNRPIPLVWNIRRGLDDATERKLMTRLMIYSSAKLSGVPSRIVYCSSVSAEQHESIGFREGKGITIGNGFDTDLFRPDNNSRDKLLAALKVSSDSVLIGNVGRYDVAKGHNYLLEAFALIAARYAKTRLVLAGRGLDIDNRTVMEQSDRLGISDRVHLLGECEHSSRLYPGFDIYCSASVSEGFPNVIAEAMSSGVPCVATNTGATGELLGDTGIVVPPRSTTALADALEVMLTYSDSQRRAMGLVSRQRILENHSMSMVGRQYARLYEDVADLPGALTAISKNGEVEGRPRFDGASVVGG